jgi:hypothetical protein
MFDGMNSFRNFDKIDRMNRMGRAISDVPQGSIRLILSILLILSKFRSFGTPCLGVPVVNNVD